MYILPMHEGNDSMFIWSADGNLQNDRVLMKCVRNGIECEIGRGNVVLGRVEEAWIKCLLRGRFVKSMLRM